MPSQELPKGQEELVQHFVAEMKFYNDRLPFGWADEYDGQPQHLKDSEDLVRRICNPFNPAAAPSESPESGSSD